MLIYLNVKIINIWIRLNCWTIIFSSFEQQWKKTLGFPINKINISEQNFYVKISLQLLCKSNWLTWISLLYILLHMRCFKIPYLYFTHVVVYVDRSRHIAIDVGNSDYLITDFFKIRGHAYQLKCSVWLHYAFHSMKCRIPLRWVPPS